MMPDPREDWNEPRPAVLPTPTYWPMFLGLACMLLVWGILTTWLMSAVGGVLFVISLTGFIRDIVREHRMEGEP